MNTQFLLDNDKRYIWHPCTQMKDMEDFPILPIKSGKGVYLYDFDNNRYIDCISSWWVNLFGHSNDYINSKLYQQAKSLEHIIFAGYTHEGIVRLSKRLISKLPQKLDKCFYADNGSSAIEIALKMSHHLHLLRGNKKHIFLSLQDSYHGETIGALSVGNVGIYKQTYQQILIDNIQTPTPKDSSQDSIQSAITTLESIVSQHKDNICAFILEPLVQCAGGMKIYPKEFIKQAVQICKNAGIFVIFDEIATGFGRSGEMFALEECEIVPDFLCLSKGITGGYLPLSVVIVSDETYEAFYGDYSKAFLHSHSYNGNPLAVACANAVLDIFENDDIIAKNKDLSDFIWARFCELSEFPIVSNIRHKGMIFAFDLNIYRRSISLEFSHLALKEGLIIRPLGNVVYFMPPYVITKDEVIFVIEKIKIILSNMK